MKKQKTITGNFIFLVLFGLLIFGCSETQGDIKKRDSINRVLYEKDNELFADKSDTGTTDTEEINAEEIKPEENISTVSGGKPDTIVIEFDKNNSLLIPGFGPGAYDEENPTPSMYKDYEFVQNNEKIDFILSEISGLSGDIRGNELFFETNKGFEIKSVLCDAQAGIFFNEDGSGGVWQEYENSEYGKEPAKQTDEFIYEVPLFEGIEDVVSNELIKKAEGNDLLSYEILLSKITVDIRYSLNGKDYRKTLVFNYEYGD